MTERDLIPRRALFDNPNAFGAKLSPDGKLVTWIAPVDDVLNIWIAPSDDIASGEPLTRTTGRPIGWQRWSADGRYVMFLNDETGDENWHVFVVDPSSKELRDLTPIENVSAGVRMWSRNIPDRIVVGINNRDARWHDFYSIDIVTGARELIWENTQQLGMIGIDWNLYQRPKLMTGMCPVSHCDGCDCLRLCDKFVPSFAPGVEDRFIVFEDAV